MSAADITSTLAVVGLADRADDAVGGFSKGMQQRLGLGVALLGSPALVILDEPTSALDPVGRVDVRSIIRRARDAGSAVFLNSHLLTEVERVCDRVAIVDHGRVLASGRLDDLLGESSVRLRVTDLSPAGRASLEAFGPVVADDDWLSITPIDPARIPDVVAAVVAAGGRVHAVDAGRTTLEERFLGILGSAAARAIGRDMSAIVTIARLTVAEAARRRILWVLLGADADQRDPHDVGARATGVDRARARDRGRARDPGRCLAGPDPRGVHVQLRARHDRGVPGAPSIAADLESGVAQAMLARPIRRADLVIGRWLGLTLIVIAYSIGSGLLEIAAVQLVTGYGPPQPLVAVGFLAAQSVVILTLALLCSTRLPAIAGGAICVVAFGLGWMAGVMAGMARFFEVGALAGVADLVPLAASDRWAVARCHLRPRAAGGRVRRPGARRRDGRGEPVLRVGRRRHPSISPGRWSGSRSCSGCAVGSMARRDL